MTSWEESCLSACLSVFQVEAGGGAGREIKAASLVRISKFHSWATLRHTPNTDTHILAPTNRVTPAFPQAAW